MTELADLDFPWNCATTTPTTAPLSTRSAPTASTTRPVPCTCVRRVWMVWTRHGYRQASPTPFNRSEHREGASCHPWDPTLPHLWPALSARRQAHGSERRRPWQFHLRAVAPVVDQLGGRSVRIRSTRPEFWSCEDIASLPLRARQFPAVAGKMAVAESLEQGPGRLTTGPTVEESISDG